MTIEETRQRIKNDDNFVIELLNKLSLYYNLKHTIRWAHTRGEKDLTESVAEHVYGMHILIDFLTPLIDIDEKLDRNLMHSYASWHDMAEAIVSDMPNSTKTKEHVEAEKSAEEQLRNEAPDYMRPLLTRVFAEYDSKLTPEAKLVKALDKIEPMFHLYFLVQKGFDKSFFDLGWPAEKYQDHRSSYIKDFDILLRFDEILFEKTKHLHPEVLK